MLSTLLLASMVWMGNGVVRVASYNVENFDTSSSLEKRAALKQVLAGLDADIIGFQEIADRASMALLLPQDEWHFIIDDDSQPSNPRFNDQDLAIAVRKPHNFRIHGSNGNASDADFLCSDAHGLLFPGKRDVLVVEVLLDGGGSVVVMNQHAKSRYGGRANTNWRREDAALEIVRRIERGFDEQMVVLLGDLNDSPDDRSLNILETGDPNARASMENDPGPFLINLTEGLWADGFVTYGWYRDGDRLVVRDPQARMTQFSMRFDNRMPQGREFATILDNILVSPQLSRFWIEGSTAVYANPIVEDASDHLPVYADFAFFAGANLGDAGLERIHGGLVLAELLVNPAGPDAGHEMVTLRNGRMQAIELKDLVLKDRAGHELQVSSLTSQQELGPGKLLRLQLPADQLPLNNAGDWVGVYAGDALLHSVTYTASQVAEGEWLTIAERIRPPREDRKQEAVAGYYEAVAGKSGAALKAGLHNLIRQHRAYDYDDLWHLLETLDADSQRGHVRGFFSQRAIPAENKAAGQAHDGAFWARAHIWSPAFGFDDIQALAHNDAHHVRAEARDLVAARGSLQWQMGGEAHSDCECQFTAESWQPPAALRGDVARMLFYMATRYEGSDGLDLELVAGMGNAAANSLGDLCTLLRWHAMDAVDDAERERNQLVFEFQGNRNPFIDHPEFATSIWADVCP